LQNGVIFYDDRFFYKERNMNEVKINKKIIIPMPWRHVTNMYLFLSEEQVNVVVAAAVASIGFLGISTALKFPVKVIPLIAILAIWVGFYRYARTHELLRRSKSLYAYHMRRLKGYTTIEKYSRSIINILSVRSLYPLKSIGKNGSIHFGENKYGYLILCTPRKTVDSEALQQIANVERFLNSLHHNILFKVSAKSQTSRTNNVQEMTARKINNKKSSQEKAILYSIHDMSSEAEKPVKWYFSIFLGIEANAKEIEPFSAALLPGIIKILENARIPCRILTDERSILENYANDFTAIRFDGVGHKAGLFGDKAIWNDIARRLMPGRIDEKEDHVIIDRNEFVSCIVVGIPRGGVSGYPSDLSPALLSQLFELSSSADSLIKLDLTVLPIESSVSVREVKRTMDRIDANKATAKGRAVVQQDLQLDRSDYEILLDRLKNGEDKLYHVSFVISVYSPSHEALTASMSRVKATLAAYSVLGEIPYGKVLGVLKSAKMLPYIDFETAVELPTTAVSRIAPIISNSNSLTAKDGTYFGNDGDEEVIINTDDLAAGHMLVLGPTGSGKTTGLLTLMVRDVVYLNRKVIYITPKPDAGTNYRAVAEYFGDDAQIIDLGPKEDGTLFYNINPLEIMVDVSTTFHAESVFYRHTSILKQFFTELCKLDSTNQNAYLELSLMELYDKFGMHPRDAKTWHPAIPPTMKDLYEIWKRDQDINVSAEALVNKTTSINYAWKFLSNPTNVDLSKKFVVIDISGVPKDLSDAMNYLLTAILSLRFNINAKQKTSIYIDEGRVFLNNPKLADDIIVYLTQARSYGIRLILATQNIKDLINVSDEFKTNTFLTLVFGNGIWKSLDNVSKFLQLEHSDVEYLRNCNKKGQALLIVGPPYTQSYHIFMKLSPMEEQIIFGKNVVADARYGIIFSNPELEEFAENQGVVFSDWIKGDASALRKSRTAIFQQRTIGSSKTWAFIKTDLIKNNMIENQTVDHYLAVCHLAGCLIERGIRVTVNHYDDADVVAEIPGSGTIAFEYQTTGHNDSTTLISKRQKCETKYGRMFFIGDKESVPEIKKSLNDDEIVISRGIQLEKLIEELLMTRSSVDTNL
jgi:hypothetical protein